MENRARFLSLTSFQAALCINFFLLKYLKKVTEFDERKISLTTKGPLPPGPWQLLCLVSILATAPIHSLHSLCQRPLTLPTQSACLFHYKHFSYSSYPEAEFMNIQFSLRFLGIFLRVLQTRCFCMDFFNRSEGIGVTIRFSSFFLYSVQ